MLMKCRLIPKLGSEETLDTQQYEEAQPSVYVLSTLCVQAMLW
jgi:hypothetical protein